MLPYLELKSPRIYFLADAHFLDPHDPVESQRRTRFRHFLEQVPNDASVFLLGDIFDYFFENARVISNRYFDIYHAIYAAGRRGVQLHFLGGNHDSWFQRFFQDDLGVTLHGDRILLRSQGRNMYCSHGDLFIPNDQSYRIIRAIIHNPFLVKATRVLLHPDWLDFIAVRVSNHSKGRNRGNQHDIANYLADIARESFFKWDNDVFIMGHVHTPLHRIHEGKDFMIVGDWIENFTYGLLKGGKLSLEKFKS